MRSAGFGLFGVGTVAAVGRGLAKVSSIFSSPPISNVWFSYSSSPLKLQKAELDTCATLSLRQQCQLLKKIVRFYF